MVGVWVIFVEKLFIHCGICLDVWFVVIVAGGHGKALINVIHGWDHLGKVVAVRCDLDKTQAMIFSDCILETVKQHGHYEQ